MISNSYESFCYMDLNYIWCPKSLSHWHYEYFLSYYKSLTVSHFYLRFFTDSLICWDLDPMADLFVCSFFSFSSLSNFSCSFLIRAISRTRKKVVTAFCTMAWHLYLNWIWSSNFFCEQLRHFGALLELFGADGAKHFLSRNKDLF